MDTSNLFRAIFIGSGLVMMAIRVYYQAQVRTEAGRAAAKDSGPSLLFGAVAAVVTLAFGIQYIFFPGTCRWAYTIRYPDAARWAGVVLLCGGEALLALAHHHLGKNFYSLVRVREGHALVESGPYRWIRHPIYTAYVMNYVGGGLVSANLVLTFVPVLCFGAMIALRVGDEERTMMEAFGEEYEAYMRHTGRFLPRFGIVSPPEG